jgi:leucyl/phenylalanyl-tRNA--protein transferase
MSEDFTGHQVLLIKCHKQRAVHSLDELHISKSTRRRSRDLSLRLDHDFSGCLTAVIETHPDRWLTDALCASLAELHLRPRHGVRARSVEIYKDDVLVAGEIGYSCGGVYTSMAGFYRLSGAGKVQLLCLGVLLRRAGYAFWDLGMPMEYKAALGARTVDRTAFLSMYRGAWTQRPGELPGSVWSCHSLLQR